MRNLINFMVALRKERDLFSIQEAAYECKCSEMTIRRFEACDGNSSGTILCYYIAQIIFKCEDNKQIIDQLLYLIKEAKGSYV